MGTESYLLVVFGDIGKSVPEFFREVMREKDKQV